MISAIPLFTIMFFISPPTKSGAFYLYYLMNIKLNCFTPFAEDTFPTRSPLAPTLRFEATTLTVPLPVLTTAFPPFALITSQFATSTTVSSSKAAISSSVPAIAQAETVASRAVSWPINLLHAGFERKS